LAATSLARSRSPRQNDQAKPNLRYRAALFLVKGAQMADTENPNQKQAGEKSEGKYHYNPGNQSGKEAEIVPKEDDAKKER
jgi:hypothetical protein